MEEDGKAHVQGRMDNELINVLCEEVKKMKNFDKLCKTKTL